MSLDRGTRLGHYEVVDLLGAGGMGEVYRATDTNLKRDVAIKILPAAFAVDPDRLARFEREAQMLAQLHHPNIASIFGLHDEAGVRFLAMELVPGETLEERIKRGVIPLDDTIAIAKKIAAGLEYAHERGIVHRDLKPANVKITPEGDVKVLDFGLAKAITGDVTASGPTSTPTIVPTMTSVGTAIGIILGTAAYMSPEQARGRPVDKRADIWAFGAVLYEMLSGQRLFDGETVSDTLAAVLTRPIDTETLGGNVPLRLRRLIARCLERDVKLRLRDIGEARIALDTAEIPIAAVAVTAQARKRSAWQLAAIPIVLLAGLAAGWYFHRAPVGETRDARYALAIPDGLTLSTSEAPEIAISRDGTAQVVVAVDPQGVSRLLLRTEGDYEPRVLAGTERAKCPFFSPDGRWIAFVRDASLFKLLLAGGAPIHVLADVRQVRGAVWGPDGFIYLTQSVANPIVRVSQDGGSPEPVTTLDGAHNERTHRWPDVLADGSAILYTADDVASTEFYDDARIEAFRLGTKERKTLVDGASMARFAPGGHLIFARGGSLYAVRFDEKTLTTSGTAALVAQPVATDIGTGAAQFAVAADGSGVWIPGESNVFFKQVWLDRQGVETIAPIPPAPYTELSISPDGKRVALAGGQGGVADLWVYEFARGTLARLTNGQFVQRPTWTPDGTKIAYAQRVQGDPARLNSWRIAMIPADGSREPEVLYERKWRQLPSAFSPDGKELLFDSDVDGARLHVWVLPLSGKREPRMILGGESGSNGGVLSPDGRWLAYVSNESGNVTVFVRPYPTGEGRWQIASQGLEPRWSPDGRELFYRDNAELYVARIDTSHGFNPGRPERVCDRIATTALLATYGVVDGGRRIFAFRTPEGQGKERIVNYDPAFTQRLAKTAAR